MWIEAGTERYKRVRENLELLADASAMVKESSVMGVISMKTNSDVREDAVRVVIEMYGNQEDAMRHAISELVGLIEG